MHAAGAKAFYQTRSGLLERMQNFAGQVYAAAALRVSPELRRRRTRRRDRNIVQRPLRVYDTLVHDLNVFKMLVELSKKPRHAARRMRAKAARPHQVSDSLQLKWIRRQCMRLTIVLHLEQMLQAPEVLIGVAKAQIFG